MSTSRIANEDRGTWPRHINHRYHPKNELKITICYLTLGKQLAPPKTYVSSELEVDCGGGFVEATQVVAIKPFGLKDKAKASRRFTHAMNVLGLKVHLHPSQRNFLIMPSPEAGQDGDQTVKQGDGAKAKSTSST